MAEGLPMCGRFSLSVEAKDMAELFGFDIEELLTPRLNIAPTQQVCVVRTSPETGKRELAGLRWGLVPRWAKEDMGAKLINARAETVTEKPSFREAFKKRRCLFPTTGFYEWQRHGTKKTPYRIGMKHSGLFAMAGIWEPWTAPTDEIIETCSILTIGPNEVMLPIHDRMPVILDQPAFETWLALDVQDPDRLKDYLVPYPAERMQAAPAELDLNTRPKKTAPPKNAPAGDGQGMLF